MSEEIFKEEKVSKQPDVENEKLNKEESEKVRKEESEKQRNEESEKLRKEESEKLRNENEQFKKIMQLKMLQLINRDKKS